MHATKRLKKLNISAYKHKVLRLAEASIRSSVEQKIESRSIFWHFYDFGEGKTSMAFIRMNCYAYGLPFEPPPALEMVSTFRLGETNSFRNSLKEIVSLFFFRFFPSSDAASLSFLLCERLHSPLTSSSTHSAPRGCFVSFLVWLARKSELSQ